MEWGPLDSALIFELYRAGESVDGCKSGDLAIFAELDKWSFTREMVFIPIYGHLLEYPLPTGYSVDTVRGDDSFTFYGLILTCLAAGNVNGA